MMLIGLDEKLGVKTIQSDGKLALPLQKQRYPIKMRPLSVFSPPN